MNRSMVVFCGQPVVGVPIGQRVGAFCTFLRRQGWRVHLASLHPQFEKEPYMVPDVLRGHEVEIIGPTHYRVEADGRRTRRDPAGYFAECRLLARRLHERALQCEADTVLLSTSLPASLFLAARLPGRPYRLCMDVDDWSAGQFTAAGGGRLVGLVYGWMERWIPRRARRITVCSRELASLYPGSVYIPNFLRVAEAPAPVRAASAPVRVAFAGTVTAYQGHEALIRILARRRTEMTGLEMVILGGGDELPVCRKVVHELGMEGLIHLTGPLSRPAVLSALSGMAIGVLPLWEDRVNRARFPLKLLDYLACGCAIAASDTGMARDVLRHRQTAMLSPAADFNRLVDHVFELARSPALCERLSANGLELIRQFDEDAVCARWMQALEWPK